MYLERECGSVAILPFPRVEVHVEIPKKIATVAIEHLTSTTSVSIAKKRRKVFRKSDKRILARKYR